VLEALIAPPEPGREPLTELKIKMPTIRVIALTTRELNVDIWLALRVIISLMTVYVLRKLDTCARINAATRTTNTIGASSNADPIVETIGV